LQSGALIYLAGTSAVHRYYGIAVFWLVTSVVLSWYRFESMWTDIIWYFLCMGSWVVGRGSTVWLFPACIPCAGGGH
jgi:hypothetical protein